MSYKISVIIPVFNAEKYLEHTIETIVNQSIGFENIQLILIDDKSTDNSSKIIKKYADKYDNVVAIFSDVNHGFPGFGRNTGIKLATGDYIMFCDNDDEYCPEICEKLYNLAIKEKTDIAACNYIESDDISINKSKPLFSDEKITVVPSEEVPYIKDFFIWNKIYDKKILSDIKFIEDGINEDYNFSIQLFLKSLKIVYLNDYWGYNHILRGSSLSNFDANKVVALIDSYYPILDIIKKSNKNIDLDRIFDRRIIGPLKRAILNGNKKDIKLILRKLQVFEKEINFNGELPAWMAVINNLILKNHITLATYICIIINKFTKLSFLKKIYRNVERK